jgi:DHA1 family bicyclomycin/chloramphenicol resistance-like MFS transporter
MVFLAIIFSIVVAGAEIDIVIPSFPEMRTYFDVSPFMVELVLGVNLFFNCIAALFSGALGDKFGKKRVINYGFWFFIAGSLISAFAPNFSILLIGRAIQGIGVAPIMVLSFIIAIEGRQKGEEEKVMGLLNGFSTLAVSIAPTIGSYISYYFTWKGNFWFLFAVGIISFLFFQIIPPDKTHDKDLKISIKYYISLMKNRLVFLYVIVICLTIASYYTFVALAPILYIESLGVNLKQFGFYQGSLTLVFGIFSIASGWVIKLLGKKVSFYFSLFLIIAFIFTNIIISVLGVRDPIIITLTLLMLSVGFVIPCNMMFVLALDIIPQAKGKISALISTIKWVFAVIAIQGASLFYNGGYAPIGIVITFLVAISFLLAIILWKEDINFKKAINQ